MYFLFIIYDIMFLLLLEVQIRDIMTNQPVQVTSIEKHHSTLVPVRSYKPMLKITTPLK